MVSDCVTNCVRVVKAIRQAEGVTYSDAVSMVVQKDGWLGLVGRGLKTRIFLNGIQGFAFTVVWKHMEEQVTSQM